MVDHTTSCNLHTSHQGSCYFHPLCMDVPWTARRLNQSILKEIHRGDSLEGLVLMLKLQYFGHLMQRNDSLEKTLMLGRIEGGRRRGWQRIRWLDDIMDLMSMSSSKLREIVKDREAWRAAVHEAPKSRTWLSTHTHTGTQNWDVNRSFQRTWFNPLQGASNYRTPILPKPCCLCPSLQYLMTLSRLAAGCSSRLVVQSLSRVCFFGTPWTAACRPPCPSPSPGVCSNSCPLCRWCHPTISSSVVPFSSCPQSSPASGSFPTSRLFESGGQSHQSFSFSISPPNEY